MNRIASTRLLIGASAALVIVCCNHQVVSAHHSFAVFDTTTQKSITGVVKRVDWTNPHTWIWIDVDGVSYGFEGMSPNFLARRGWTRTTLQPGAKLTITFRPFKDESQHGGMFVSTTLSDGTVLSLYGAEKQ